MSAANEPEVEGTVPSQWWLDLKVENQRLRAGLEIISTSAGENIMEDGVVYGPSMYAKKVLDA